MTCLCAEDERAVELSCWLRCVLRSDQPNLTMAVGFQLQVDRRLGLLLRQNPDLGVPIALGSDETLYFCNGYIRNVQCRKDVINEKKKKRRAHTFQGVDELVSEYAMCERGRRHGHGATVAVNKERRERGGRGERGDVVGLHCADIDPPVLGRRQFSAWNAFNPNHSARLPYGS